MGTFEDIGLIEEINKEEMLTVERLSVACGYAYHAAIHFEQSIDMMNKLKAILPMLKPMDMVNIQQGKASLMEVLAGTVDIPSGQEMMDWLMEYYKDAVERHANVTEENQDPIQTHSGSDEQDGAGVPERSDQATGGVGGDPGLGV